MTLPIAKGLRLIAIVAATGCAQPVPASDAPSTTTRAQARAAVRAALFAEIQPVKLANCDFERVGDSYDGGYVICKNLVVDAEAFYSYGIDATDNWGCTLSARHQRPVHQYDCFNTKRPVCEGATPVFHEECVGPKRETVDGRLFDTVEAQIARNGDSGKRLVVKMDVEGAEWPSLLSAPDSVLERIDHFNIEFHGVEETLFADTMAHLARLFHVVNIHYNNYTCSPDLKPFYATTFELLLVNKKIGKVDPGAKPVIPNPLDAPNGAARPDCQPPAP